jgi:hypothetical protein
MNINTNINKIISSLQNSDIYHDSYIISKLDTNLYSITEIRYSDTLISYFDTNDLKKHLNYLREIGQLIDLICRYSHKSELEKYESDYNSAEYSEYLEMCENMSGNELSEYYENQYRNELMNSECEV